MKLLSIIIPVYKVERYVNKCLNTCVIYKADSEGHRVVDTEKMDRLEVIIINDGTPDSSAEISREYVKRYPDYFRQIDKENGGHGSVWNLGIKEANGKYIKFLDSDDWLENLDVFIEKLLNTDSDLVLTSTKCHCQNDEVWIQQIVDMDFYKSYDADSFDWLGNRTHNYLLHHTCTYKTEVLRQYLPGLFLEHQPYDDIILWPAAMIGGKSIEAFDFPLYNYLMDRPGQSISDEVRSKNSDAQKKSEKHTIGFYESHPVPETSTKYGYIRKRLPKLYSSPYRTCVHYPYSDGKNYLAEWNEWARETNPEMMTMWIRAYRMLPYMLYRPLCLSAQWVISKYNISVSGPARYKKYDQ